MSFSTGVIQLKPRPPDVGRVSPGKAALDKPVFLHLHPILFHLSDGQIEKEKKNHEKKVKGKKGRERERKQGRIHGYPSRVRVGRGE